MWILEILRRSSWQYLAFMHMLGSKFLREDPVKFISVESTITLTGMVDFVPL